MPSTKTPTGDGEAGDTLPPSTSELRQRRDEFVETFFRKGTAFTDELISENERLIATVAQLERDNANLRAHLASDTAIRDLLTKIDELEREKDALLRSNRAADASSQSYESRSQAIEDELSMLANVYVASYQLGSTLRLDRVMRHVNELLGQLVGSRSHAIYLASPKARELTFVTGEGVSGREARGFAIGDVAPGDTLAARIERAYLTGTAHVAEDPHALEEGEPAAVIPLRIDEDVVGLIAIYRVLTQKLTFVAVDFELFKLLSAHAATALFGGRLYEDTDRKLPSFARSPRGSEENVSRKAET